MCVTEHFLCTLLIFWLSVFCAIFLRLKISRYSFYTIKCSFLLYCIFLSLSLFLTFSLSLFHFHFSFSLSLSFSFSFSFSFTQRCLFSCAYFSVTPSRHPRSFCCTFCSAEDKTETGRVFFCCGYTLLWALLQYAQVTTQSCTRLHSLLSGHTLCKGCRRSHDD